MESFEDYMRRKEERRLNGKKKPQGLKKSRLRPVSKKQSKRNQAYAKAREEHYSDDSNKACAICGRTENLSIHHSAKRGSNIADARTFITLCVIGDTLARTHPELNYSSLGCHGFVEANKGWARENGYLE